MSENIELETQNTGDNIENQDSATGDENLNNDPQGGSDDTAANTDNEADKTGDNETGIYGAPEVYNYEAVKIPEGYEYDKDMLKEFDALNKELNLSQASANKYMEFGLRIAQKSVGDVPNILKQAQQAKITQFQAALNADKEISGGGKTAQNAYLDVADKGYSAFANDDVKAALADAGLNYHPAIVKMFHRIGELVGDDQIFAPRTPSGSPADPADILYGANGN